MVAHALQLVTRLQWHCERLIQSYNADVPGPAKYVKMSIEQGSAWLKAQGFGQLVGGMRDYKARD